MKRAILAAALAIAALAGWGATRWLYAPPADTRHIEMWKSQTCGCCTDWIAYVESHGYSVEVHDVDDVDPIKDQFNVPLELRSCHTARIASLTLEGHVPVEVIAKVLDEHPTGVEGIAVPGMPSGAPGMDEDGTAYRVVTFGNGRIDLLR